QRVHTKKGHESHFVFWRGLCVRMLRQGKPPGQSSHFFNRRVAFSENLQSFHPLLISRGIFEGLTRLSGSELVDDGVVGRPCCGRTQDVNVEMAGRRQRKSNEISHRCLKLGLATGFDAPPHHDRYWLVFFRIHGTDRTQARSAKLDTPRLYLDSG